VVGRSRPAGPLYLGSSCCARPLPSRRSRPCRSSRSLHSHCCPRGLAFYVGFPKRSIETRSFPNSLAASLAVLPSMSLFPNASYRPFGLPIYAWHAVALAKEGRSRPHGSIHSLPTLTLAPTLIALPSMLGAP